MSDVTLTHAMRLRVLRGRHTVRNPAATNYGLALRGIARIHGFTPATSNNISKGALSLVRGLGLQGTETQAVGSAVQHRERITLSADTF